MKKLMIGGCARACLALAAMAAASIAVAREIYVSPSGDDATGDGSASAPYATPTFALQQATTEGDVVNVGAGVYLLSETPVVKAKSLTIQGWNATRDQVVFDGQGERRCLSYPVDDSGVTVYDVVKDLSDVKVSGITFRNGFNGDAVQWNNWSGVGGGVLLGMTVGSESPSHLVPGVVVSNCVFESCATANGAGGGLFVGGGATVVDCLFTNCVARSRIVANCNGVQGGGGGAFATAHSGDAFFTRCTFVGNVATNGAAALGSGSYSIGFATNNYGLVVKDCVFRENVGVSTLSNDGQTSGCLSPRTWRVEDCVFTDNRIEGTVKNYYAAAYGSVFTASLTPTPTRTNEFVRCTFSNNVSVLHGAVAAANDARLTLSFADCRFEANTGNNGAAIAAAGSCVLMTNTVVRNHASTEYYGPVIVGANSFLQDCTFNCNTSAYQGVIMLSGAGATVDRCRFDGNNHYGASWGGWNNVAGAAALDVRADGAAIRNCLFYRNTARVQVGAAIFLGGNDATIENCTFAENLSPESKESDVQTYSGAAIATGKTTPTGAAIRNCLFSGNTGKTFAGVPQVASALRDAVTYSWTSTDELAVTDATHNLAVGDGNARFDASAPGECRPGARTPGRDQGLTLDWMAGATDLYGAPRVAGASVDFGCAERVPTGLMLIIR